MVNSDKWQRWFNQKHTLQLKKKNLTTQTRNGQSAQFFSHDFRELSSILAAQLKINLVQMGILQKRGGKEGKQSLFAPILNIVNWLYISNAVNTKGI